MSNDFFPCDGPRGRCDLCRYGHLVYANGRWSFYECYHNPYSGKWVAEIKDCPIASEEEMK